jgi:hypothetical protein
VAPPSEDGAEKYKDMSLEELQNECKLRDIDFDANATEPDLIKLLYRNDNEPDWAEIYADLIQFGINYFDIPEMTIPAITAIREKFFDRAPFMMRMPGLLGGITNTSTPTHPSDGKPPKLSQFANFCSVFN